MIEGVFFYWFGWIAFTIVYFLLPKSKLQRDTALLILLFIALSSVSIPILGVGVGGTFILLVISAYRFLLDSSRKQKVTLLGFSLILSTVYVLFLYHRWYDPVWLYQYPEWIFAIPVSLVIFCFIRSVQYRYGLLLASMVQGEVCFYILFQNEGRGFPFAGVVFYDIVAVSAAVLSFLMTIEWFIHLLRSYISGSRPVHHVHSQRVRNRTYSLPLTK
ncbi:YphA family membrane protein [Texcoconibacillus texcoconensis]|uniref:Putative membrane protein n=1 Tax=Texcoconibacillus texcoconensis TaxID=1095777 RepID=A0A840QNH6_9BACI|nr:hypothetical protein [Texcoconibacillus texcoconensis]MBB5172908.1 putative membrane protein [Texcoconibacillus texcoconensis]